MSQGVKGGVKGGPRSSRGNSGVSQGERRLEESRGVKREFLGKGSQKFPLCTSDPEVRLLMANTIKIFHIFVPEEQWQHLMGPLMICKAVQVILRVQSGHGDCSRI